MKKILRYHWLIFIASWLVTAFATALPSFAEWPIAPVVFLFGIPVALIKNGGQFDAFKFLAVLIGALSTQILFWI